MNAVRQYTVDQYIDALTEFHGNFAPGLLVGGFMVAAAIQRMTKYEYFNAICESTSCLPDAIQMRTPCTVGNGWFKIVNAGRFAIILYEKKSGDGVRVSMNAGKLHRYPEINKWFMRLAQKRDQDKETLIHEIRSAGQEIFSIEQVTVSPELREMHADDRIIMCGSCGEAHPDNSTGLCFACQGMDIFRKRNETWR